MLGSLRQYILVVPFIIEHGSRHGRKQKKKYGMKVTKTERKKNGEIGRIECEMKERKHNRK